MLLPILSVLYFYIGTFWSTCAVPKMAAFCTFLISWYPYMLIRYFMKCFEMIPFAPIITGIAFVFTLHMRCISVVR
jgi:hypothetical protein